MDAQKIANLAESLYQSAVERGYNVQAKLEPESGPVVIIAIVQPEDLDRWVGLPDLPESECVPDERPISQGSTSS